MNVFVTIWILAVLIQEVVPSTLVRLPRNAAKNLSLVHTEYEAKYEQKGKHGNESFSTVSGKQEIVHDNCAENWNTFAEKCASLIKDLVASLANAVSSKPGDATNLQLHIKNTFKHFDNTHNCTCLNHTGKSLSDLDLSPLFNNITIKTVGPITKRLPEGHYSDLKNDKNVGIIPTGSPLSRSPTSDKNDSEYQKQSKKCSHSVNEFCDEANDTVYENPTGQEEQKQLNRALVDTENSNMNPENIEYSSDQSNNNSRRQIKYPPNTVPFISKPSKDYSSEQAQVLLPEDQLTDGYKSVSESPVNNKQTGQSPVILPEEPATGSQTSSPVLVPGKFQNRQNSVPINSQPSSQLPVILPEEPATGLQTSNPILVPVVSKPLEPSNSQPSSQLPVILPEEPATGLQTSNPILVPVVSKPLEPSNSQPSSQLPVILPEEPATGSQMSSPVLVPGKFQNGQTSVPIISKPLEPFNSQPSSELPVILPEETATGSQTSNPILVPGKFQNGQNSVPVVSKPLESINSQPRSQSPVVFPEDQLTDSYNSNPPIDMPLRSVGSEPSLQSSVKFPEKQVNDSHILSPVFIPKEAEIDQNSMPSMIKPEKSDNNKLNEQPINKEVELPVIDNSEPSKAMSGKLINSEAFTQPIISLPKGSAIKSLASDPSAIVPAAPIESDSLSVVPEEHSDNQPENPVGRNQNFTSPVFVRNERPIQEFLPEQRSFTTLKDDGLVQAPVDNLTNEKESSPVIPVSYSNANLSQPSGLINNDETILPVHEPFPVSSAPNPSLKSVTGIDSAILSPEDILPLPTNEKSILEELTTSAPTTTECAETGNGLDHITPLNKPIPIIPVPTEVANQPLRDLTSIKEALPITPIPGQFSPIVPVSTSKPQYLDPELNSPAEGHQWDSQPLISELTFSTPAPAHSGNPVTIIPVGDNQSKPAVIVENYDPKEKELVVTEIPFVSNIPGEPKQPDVGIVGDKTQIKQDNAPMIPPENVGTTPVIIYPVKSLPIETQSLKEPFQESINPGLVNNENQSALMQEIFTTLSPIYTVKPIQTYPKQQNGNADAQTQPIVRTENSVSQDPTDVQQERLVTFSPNKESDDVQYSRVTIQPIKITAEPVQPNSDYLQQGNNAHSPSLTTNNSEIAPMLISSEPETAMSPPVLKSSQPGALVPISKDQLQQEEDQNPLMQPTTFQTTSEEPTPRQDNIHAFRSEPPSLFHLTTSVPQDSDETIPYRSSTSPKTTEIHEHDDDDDEDCCSCESCTEEEITDPKQYKENACKNLEEARKELKAIFDKIKKKLKCGKKAS